MDSFQLVSKSVYSFQIIIFTSLATDEQMNELTGKEHGLAEL